MIRSVLIVTLGVAITGFMSFWCVIFSLIPGSENRIHKIARLWAKILLLMSNTKVEVIGARNITLGKPQIFMANHQSDFDILISLAHIPVQFRWIAKKELFAIPVFGAAMRSAGYIEIDRSNREKAMQSIDEAALRIRSGKSVMTFPEGTRSRDGQLAPFNKGVFSIAHYCNAPLALIFIEGTDKLFRPGSFSFNTRDFNEMKVELMDFLDPDYQSREFSTTVLANYVRKLYEKRAKQSG